VKTIRWGVIGAGGIAARRTIPETLATVEGVEFVCEKPIATRRVIKAG
jgi:predicted dehydrogenase